MLRWNSTGIPVADITLLNGTAPHLLYRPYGLMVDPSNTLYVSDYYNHRVQKWSFSSSTGITVAGQANSSSCGYLNCTVYSTTVLVDSVGGLYVAESGYARVTYWPVGSSAGRLVAGNGRRRSFITRSLSCAVDTCERSPIVSIDVVNRFRSL